MEQQDEQIRELSAVIGDRREGKVSEFVLRPEKGGNYVQEYINLAIEKLEALEEDVSD